MKPLLLSIMLVFFSATLFSQKVEFKKGMVVIDGKEALKYDGNEFAGHISFSNLKGEEIIFVKVGKSVRYDTYWINTFLKDKKSITSKYQIPTKKSLIEKLVKDGVLVDGEIVSGKLDNFIF